MTCLVFSRADKEQKESPMKVRLYLTLMNSNSGQEVGGDDQISLDLEFNFFGCNQERLR